MVNVDTIHNWFSSSDRKRSIINNHLSLFRHTNHQHSHDGEHETLGILAFDTAKTMSRLLSLYKSLSDSEINRLTRDAVKSRGVVYLNSDDEGFLLKLACAERLEDLDRVANVVARLGLKCSDYGLSRFDQIYRELKLGNIDGEKLSYGVKEVEKIVDKMEKMISQTSNLYEELQALSELEISERKLITWRKSAAAGAGYTESSGSNSNPHLQANFDLFDQKMGYQRKLVRHYKQVSLWNQSYDKTVGTMARVVCVLYARICAVFGPYVSILPTSSKKSHGKKSQQQRLAVAKGETWRLFDNPAIKASRSGPIVPTSSTPANSNNKASLVRFLSSDGSSAFASEIGFCVGFGIGCRTSDGCHGGSACPVHHNNRVFRAAPATTVGGSGMAMRYANVIALAENYLKSNAPLSEEAREDLYDMLPAGMKGHVRSKLRNAWRQMARESAGRGDHGDALSEGWRQAITDILEWLSPMGQDTLTWQTERNMERQKFDAKPTVLLLQTLHYSDVEKTEAAIANVLVGLSCIFWYENRRPADDDVYGVE